MSVLRLATPAPIFFVCGSAAAEPAPVAVPPRLLPWLRSQPLGRRNSLRTRRSESFSAILRPPWSSINTRQLLTNPKMLTPEAAVYRFSYPKPLARDIFTDATLAAIGADLAAREKN